MKFINLWKMHGKMSISGFREELTISFALIPATIQLYFVQLQVVFTTAQKTVNKRSRQPRTKWISEGVLEGCAGLCLGLAGVEEAGVVQGRVGRAAPAGRGGGGAEVALEVRPEGGQQLVVLVAPHRQGEQLKMVHSLWFIRDKASRFRHFGAYI